MKKILFYLIIALFSVAAYGQSGFRIEIKQVFPKSSLVYSNVFNFKREMDNAITSQSAKLRGNNSNYKVQITTPNGSETRYIQNVVWMESVNGVKTYHKQKTNPANSYDVSTIWEGCLCNADGSAKGAKETHEFVYRVSTAPNEYATPFVEKGTALAKADELYRNLHAKDRLVKVIVYSFREGNPTTFLEKENAEEYKAFFAQKKIEEEKVKVEKRLQEIRTNVIEFKTKMTSIAKQCDSLTLDQGLNDCHHVLKTAKVYVPDTTFVKEKLDSLYKDALLKNVLLTKEGKKIRKHITVHEAAIQSNSSIDSLLNHTKAILSTKDKINSKKAK